MKNTMACFGIIALVAVIGFSVIACDNGTTGGDRALNGTWINQAGERLVFNNGNFTVYNSNVESVRGTYSTRGDNLTLTITQIRGSSMGSDAARYGFSANQWYTRQQFRTVFINYAVSQGLSQSQAATLADEAIADSGLYNPMTGTYSVGSNTLVINGAVLIRQ